MMSGHVFISYSREDIVAAESLAEGLRAEGYRVWRDREDILAGQEWSSAIAEAIQSADAYIILVSGSSERSHWVQNEMQLAIDSERPLLPVMLAGVTLASQFRLLLAGHHCLATDGDMQTTIPRVVGALRRLGVAPEPADAAITASADPTTSPAGESADASLAGMSPAVAKGYVFISYGRSDSDFVHTLTDVLKRRGYAYWDYQESERNFHTALFRELEEQIERAAAFMTIVSDTWRDTEWTAGEYIYAREAKVPIFVIQAKPLSRPMPIILNQQTRIDMSIDFERGARILEHELDKKNL